MRSFFFVAFKRSKRWKYITVNANLCVFLCSYQFLNRNEIYFFFLSISQMEAVPLKHGLFLPLHWRCKVLSNTALEAPEPLRCSSGATVQLFLPATCAGLVYRVLIDVIKDPVINGSAECLAVSCSRLGRDKWFTDTESTSPSPSRTDVMLVL